jgi:hypothetical protein
VIGNGTGGFSLGATIHLGQVGGSAIRVADLNADGRADLLTIDSDGFNYFQNNGAGAFTPILAALENGDTWGFFSLADINGDNTLEIITAGGFNNLLVRMSPGPVKLYEDNPRVFPFLSPSGISPSLISIMTPGPM